MRRPIGLRVQDNFLARHERRILNFLCARIPEWVVPDHLTIIGLVGAAVAFIGYIASRSDPVFLWLASVGLALNWFGDSLDGSLARYRHCERARYGYFLDSMMDVFCSLIIMMGLGLSTFVHLDVALLALIGYYLLCMYVFLNHHLNNVHQLSFLGCGPTETRLGLVALNVCMFAQGRADVVLGGWRASTYDILLVGSAIVSLILFVRRMAGGIEQLAVQESESLKTSVPNRTYP
jgi:archaetidylinositol phosphate synthase